MVMMGLESPHGVQAPPLPFPSPGDRKPVTWHCSLSVPSCNVGRTVATPARMTHELSRASCEASLSLWGLPLSWVA